MLQEQLKEATKAHHDQLEQLMFVNQIMDGALTPAQYQKLLVTNYLSHAYFEDYIFNNLSTDLQQQLALTDRVKLPFLLKDVEELLIPIPEIPTNVKLNPIPADDASLLGALYVMEGATLGGHVIVKRLLVNPNLAPLDLHFHYYQAYGPSLINKWKDFVQVLNTYVAPDDYHKAIKSASDMFDNMRVLAENS